MASLWPHPCWAGRTAFAHLGTPEGAADETFAETGQAATTRSPSTRSAWICCSAHRVYSPSEIWIHPLAETGL